MQVKTAKRGNRLLCLLLALVMVCSLLPMSALAAEENTAPAVVTEEPAAEPEQAAEAEEPSAEPAAIPAVQADETGTEDDTDETAEKIRRQ